MPLARSFRARNNGSMILTRYLVREVSQAFLAVFGVLVLIYVSHRFVRYLALAATGDLDRQVILELLGLKVVIALGLIVPLAFFLAVLLGLGRLYRDSEITAMMAGGIGMGRILWSVSGLSLAVALAVAVIALYLAPQAFERSTKLQTQPAEMSEIRGIIAGQFRELGHGRRVFYAEHVSSDRSQLENVFVQVADRDPPFILASEGGRQYVDPKNGDRFLVLENGYRYGGSPGRGDYVITHFVEHAVRIKESPVVPGDRKVAAVSSPELWESADPRWAGELQWRISMPVSVVLLGALGVLLARTSSREGRYGKLFTGILAYFLYSNLLGIVRELVEQREVAVAVGLWPVHGAMVLVVAGVFGYQSVARWRLAPAIKRLLTYKRNRQAGRA